jgi:hypothetical protein
MSTSPISENTFDVTIPSMLHDSGVFIGEPVGVYKKSSRTQEVYAVKVNDDSERRTRRNRPRKRRKRRDRERKAAIGD